MMGKSVSLLMAVLRRHFLPNVQFECCMILQGTLDMFATNGESTAWVLLWKTRSRPIGVRVYRVAQFNYFSNALDPRAWTMVVCWKENVGRQPQLITLEKKEVRPIIRLRGPQKPPGPPAPAPTPAGDGERVKPRSSSRERQPLRPSQPEPQLIPMVVDDGDDDQSPKEERQRGRSRSRERMHNLHKLNLCPL